MTMTETEYVRPIVTLSVYRNAELNGDCTNGGVSGQFNSLLLYPAGTLASEVDPVMLARAVVITVRDIGGPVFSLVPLAGPEDTERKVGPMAGGNYAWTSDSRFAREAERAARLAGYDATRWYGAMAVHDRYETPAQYRALSI